MKRFLLWVIMYSLSYSLIAQGFEITGFQESYKGTIGEVIRVPLNFKNNGTRPLTLIIRKAGSQIGTSQKNYFCLDGDCLDQSVEDYIVKIDPGQTLNSLQVALEAGLVPGISSVRYIAFNKSNPTEALEVEFNFVATSLETRSKNFCIGAFFSVCNLWLSLDYSKYTPFIY